MLKVLGVAGLVHDCLRFEMSQVVAGHEVCRVAVLVPKDEVGSQVVQLSVAEELVERFVEVDLLKTISQNSRVNKRDIHTICRSIE
jgi:hypothetical protein